MSTHSFTADLSVLEQISRGNAYGIIYPLQFCDVGDLLVVHGKHYRVLDIFTPPQDFNCNAGLINCGGNYDGIDKFIHVIAYAGPDGYKCNKSGVIELGVNVDITEEIREMLIGIFNDLNGCGISDSTIARKMGWARCGIYYMRGGDRPHNKTLINYQIVLLSQLYTAVCMNNNDNNTSHLDSLIKTQLQNNPESQIETAITPQEEMRKCSKCGEYNPISAYHSYTRNTIKGKKTEIRADCKRCHNAWSAAYKKVKKERKIVSEVLS